MSTISTTWPREGVALITMTDPKTPQHNVTWATVDALAKALEAARTEGARVVVLTSGQPGFWLNHAYLKDLRDLMSGDPKFINDPDRKLTTTGWMQCQVELEQQPVISIAAINGDCSGGGLELGWSCDLRIAETGCLLSQPEVVMGFPPGIGGTSRLRRLIGRAATYEMVLLGKPMSPERLQQLGAINLVVPKGDAVKTALEWADRLAGMQPAALAAAKKQLTFGEDVPLAEALVNDQKLASGLFGAPASMELMKQIQERYDAGEHMREIFSTGKLPKLEQKM
ncbi:enoyl-CoA hydratase/isomerase family protein [Hyaloraphidium curvatum]|nr:enoyl-CoA hydratase/isomerase family protein [Hyaloraphidium curvatum]